MPQPYVTGTGLLDLNLATVVAAAGGDAKTNKKGTWKKAAKSKRAVSKGLAKDCKDGFGKSLAENVTGPPPAARLLLKREKSLALDEQPASDDAQAFLGNRPSPTHHAILENRPWVLRYMLSHDRETLQNDFLSPSVDETEALPLHLLAWSVQCHEILAHLLLHLDDDVRYACLANNLASTSNRGPPTFRTCTARAFGTHTCCRNVPI
jgi:hypothetical protein